MNLFNAPACAGALSFDRASERDLARTDKPRQPRHGVIQRGAAGLGDLHTRLPPESLDLQNAAIAMELGIQPADEPLPFEDRQHVIAVATLGGGYESFEGVIEAEEAHRTLPIAN